MRAFLGISISNELKPRITSVQDRFFHFDIKFVEKENLHFNLKFFKEISDEDVEKLKTFLQGAFKQIQAFDIEIEGLGAFPSSNYVRVIWLGVKEGYQMLASIAEIIEKATESMGYETDEKFVPHLTLGRVRTGRNKNEMITLLKDLEDVKIGRMRVSEAVLFRSKLSPNGPVYEEAFRIKLGSTQYP
jgi:RNA 2',3'-cyclic 3'-phosphodiesterase